MENKKEDYCPNLLCHCGLDNIGHFIGVPGCVQEKFDPPVEKKRLCYCGHPHDRHENSPRNSKGFLTQGSNNDQRFQCYHCACKSYKEIDLTAVSGPVAQEDSWPVNCPKGEGTTFRDDTVKKDWFRFLPQSTGYLMIEGTIDGKPRVMQIDMRDEETRNSLVQAFMAMGEITVGKVTVGEGKDKHEQFQVVVSILPPSEWKGWL